MFKKYVDEINENRKRIEKLEKKVDCYRLDEESRKILENEMAFAKIKGDLSFKKLFRGLDSVTSLIFRDEKGLYRIDTPLKETEIEDRIRACGKQNNPKWKIINAISTKYCAVLKSFGPYHTSTSKTDIWQNGYFYNDSVITYSINNIWVTDDFVNAITINNLKAVDREGMNALTGVSRTFNGETDK